MYIIFQSGESADPHHCRRGMEGEGGGESGTIRRPIKRILREYDECDPW